MRNLLPAMLLLGCSDAAPGAAREAAPAPMRAEPPPTTAPASAERTDESARTRAEPADARAPTTPRAARTVGPPVSGAAVLPPAVGQWARYALRWRDGRRSITEYRIVDRVDERWVLEVIDRREPETRVVEMVLERSAEGPHRLHGLAFKTGGRLNRVPERTIAHFAPTVQQWTSTLWPTLPSGDAMDVDVPAGRFAGCVKGEQRIEFQGREMHADVWYHTAVPITAMVRFASSGADQGHTLELVDYGEEGARSEL